MTGSQDALQAAMERLPLKPGVDVEGRARALAFTGPMVLMNDRHDLSASKRAGGAGKDLDAFVRRARSLLKVIDEMHGDAIAMVSEEVRHPYAVADDLRTLVRRSEAALKDYKPAPARHSNARVGPQQLADVCAVEFLALTGLKPVRSNDRVTGKPGPFLQFVMDVFAAFRLKANAENYARKARVRDTIGGAPGITVTRVNHSTQK